MDPGDALDHPVVVRDRPRDFDVPIPPAFPAVVLAACAGSPGPGPVAGADIALTECPHAQRPWVVVSDLAAAVALVEARVAHAAKAAVILVQVLRLTESIPLEAGLVVESMAYSALQAGPEFARWRSGRERRRLRPPDGGEVLVDRRGDLLIVTLNRPEVHNAYNSAMRDGLCEALAAAAADPTCRVELRGAGPSFCSGGDLDEFGTAPDPTTAHLVRTARSPARMLAGLAGRVDARLHGVCAGSGIELPAFAGRVHVDASARIWLPELAMGLIPGAGGTASLTRRIGRHRTAWMGLSGEEVDAPTALRWGLADALSGQGE